MMMLCCATKTCSVDGLEELVSLELWTQSVKQRRARKCSLAPKESK